ncbi:YgjV family protein [Oscillibacter sp.]|uniref:YgjV family protein n=1 Tax=Oscillibacter sp. TaxID=1945593 RepID=UPI0028A13FF3|nr:YgjV family protein [Oscillibacter sp.]
MYAIAVQLIGFVGMAFCIGCFQIKSSRWMILCQMAGNLLFVVQFLMLGAYSGCATLAFGAASSLFIGLEGHAWAEWKGWQWVFALLTVAACLLTWSKPYDFFVLVGQVAFILTTWTKNGRIIRLGKLTLVGPPWIVYNLLVRSYGGVISETFGIISTLISSCRFGLKALYQNALKKRRPGSFPRGAFLSKRSPRACGGSVSSTEVRNCKKTAIPRTEILCKKA